MVGQALPAQLGALAQALLQLPESAADGRFRAAYAGLAGARELLTGSRSVGSKQLQMSR